MPWGSWVSCEVTLKGPDVGPDFTGTGYGPRVRQGVGLRHPQRDDLRLPIPGPGHPGFPDDVTASQGDERCSDESSGSTFGADGGTLFVNIRASADMTFAIRGPWESIGV